MENCITEVKVPTMSEAKNIYLENDKGWQVNLTKAGGH